jgi:tRNA(Ile)-lysidine synthase
MPTNFGDALIARVRRFVAQHQLAASGTRVAVALSGGSDSVALAHLIRELEGSGELRAAGLIHFNHRLRDTAERDEQFSTRLAESFGWPMVVEREDVALRARRERRSIEDAARTARYQGFDRARVMLGADVVALGHTRDDQAETFLLRLIRGAGPKGMAGMHPRRGPIVRPLLCCLRTELRQFLAARQIVYVEDETNADVTIPRNRVRAELLPMLAGRFNPAVVDALANEAELAREMWLWMEDSFKASNWSLSPGGERHEGDRPDGDLDVAQLLSVPAPIRRFVVWRVMSEVAGARPVSFVHVETVLELLRSELPRSVDMPGHSVQRLGRRLVLRRRRVGDCRRPRDARPNFFEYPLSIPGGVQVLEADCLLTADLLAGGTFDPEILRANPGTAMVPRALCTGQWRIRNRRPGDRFRPLGMNGQKKLQDFFVDRKVPRPSRDTVPLVVDNFDRIVWVAGFGIDHAFRVTDPAQAVIMLQLKLLGGAA